MSIFDRAVHQLKERYHMEPDEATPHWSPVGPFWIRYFHLQGQKSVPVSLDTKTEHLAIWQLEAFKKILPA